MQLQHMTRSSNITRFRSGNIGLIIVVIGKEKQMISKLSYDVWNNPIQLNAFSNIEMHWID